MPNMPVPKEESPFKKPALPSKLGIQQWPPKTKIPSEPDIYKCDPSPSITPAFHDQKRLKSSSLSQLSNAHSSTHSSRQPPMLTAPIIFRIFTYYFDDFFSNEWDHGDRPVNDQDFSMNRQTGNYPMTDLILYNCEYRPLLDRLTRSRDPDINNAIRKAFWCICGSRSALFLGRRNNLRAMPWAYPPDMCAQYVTRLNIVVQSPEMDDRDELPQASASQNQATKRMQGDLQFLHHLFSGDYGSYSSLTHIGLDVRSEEKAWEWYLTEEGGTDKLANMRTALFDRTSLAREKIPSLLSIQVQGIPDIDIYKEEVKRKARAKVNISPTEWNWKSVWEREKAGDDIEFEFKGLQPLTTVDMIISAHKTIERTSHTLWMGDGSDKRGLPSSKLMLEKNGQ